MKKYDFIAEYDVDNDYTIDEFIKMATDAKSKGANNVSVSASWDREVQIGFYRERDETEEESIARQKRIDNRTVIVQYKQRYSE